MPEELLTLLDGADLHEKIGTTVLLVTNGGDGVPRLAVLSVGEVLATGPRELRLAVHAGSRTAAALRQGSALLAVVLPSGLHRIGLRVVSAASGRLPGGGREELFVAEVIDVAPDSVPHARVTHGVRYALDDPEAAVSVWTDKLDLLRGLRRLV